MALLFLLIPVVAWKLASGRERTRRKFADDARKKAEDARKDIEVARANAEKERVKHLTMEADERIAAYKALTLEYQRPGNAFSPVPPELNHPTQDWTGVVIESIERLWDFRQWQPVPEHQEKEPVQPAILQSVYNIRRSADRERVVFRLRSENALAIVPDVRTDCGFLATTYTRIAPEELYPKQVLVDVNLSGIPPGVAFPFVLRATYWNAFQKPVEDAAFKAYTDADLAVMVVLFPTNRVPTHFNFWYRSELEGQQTVKDEVLEPTPFFRLQGEAIYVRIEKPRKDYVYGIVFTWTETDTRSVAAGESERDSKLLPVRSTPIPSPTATLGATAAPSERATPSATATPSETATPTETAMAPTTATPSVMATPSETPTPSETLSPPPE